MTNVSTDAVYVNEEQLKEYLSYPAAVIIDDSISEIGADHDFYNPDLSDVVQFEVEVYVFCTKGDPESQSDWWQDEIQEVVESNGLSADNVTFTIYPDDENNPNAELCECGDWDDEDHECEGED